MASRDRNDRAPTTDFPIGAGTCVVRLRGIEAAKAAGTSGGVMDRRDVKHQYLMHITDAGLVPAISQEAWESVGKALGSNVQHLHGFLSPGRKAQLVSLLCPSCHKCPSAACMIGSLLSNFVRERPFVSCTHGSLSA